MVERVRVTGRTEREPQPRKPQQQNTDEGPYFVTTPSGAEQEVLSSAERDWYERHRDEYLGEREWQSTDLSQLDQLLAAEMTQWRCSSWVSALKDHTGRPLTIKDVAGLQIRNKDAMNMANMLRDALGLSRAAKLAEAKSVQAYLFTLRNRAREFGQMRNEQIIKAVELWRELEAHVGAFDRSNSREKQVIGFPDEAALVQWVRTKIPEFNRIDEEFRRNQGKWIGTL